MDIGRFVSVAWRFRVLLGCGLLLAVLITALSSLRVDFEEGRPNIGFREEQVWISAALVQVTRQGFALGDQSEYAALATLYAELAKGDAIAREVQQDNSPGQRYEPAVMIQEGSGNAMPLIHFNGYGPSAEAAADIAKRSSQAFQRYLAAEQEASEIPLARRVRADVIQQATPPFVWEARSYVKPVLLFLVTNMVFLAIAFGLENLRPRATSSEGELRPVEPPARAA
jgi:hypothetical protein